MFDKAPIDPPPTKSTPSRATLRRMLEAQYPTSTQLDAFVLDSFFEVYQQYSQGMDYVARINLLLGQVSPTRVYVAMRQSQALPSESALPEQTAQVGRAAATPSPTPDLAPRKASEDPPHTESAEAGLCLSVPVALPASPPGVELLALLRESGIVHAFADLQPQPFLGGHRQLWLRREGDSYQLSAYPVLVEPGTLHPCAGGLQLAAADLEPRQALYLPRGPIFPGYHVSFSPGAQPVLELWQKESCRKLSFVLHTNAGETSHA